jgi:hypothetical protein
LSVSNDVLEPPPATPAHRPLRWLAFALICCILASPIVAYVIEGG